jgi:hypothetical protein
MSAHLTDEDTARIDALCLELRGILAAELAAGNTVVETWEGWGHVIMLGHPFRCAHSTEGTRVAYRDVDDPHHWKAEYFVADLKQAVACRFAS